MMNLSSENLNLHMITFFLVFVRINAFFLMTPFFGSDSMFSIIKTYIAGFIAYFAYISPQVSLIENIPDIWFFTMFIAKEISIGLILGYTTSLIYLPFKTAGDQIGRTSGLGRAMLTGLDNDGKFNVLAQILNIIAILLFYSFNGHHFLLNLIIYTFKIIPIGLASFNGEIIHLILSFFNKSFNVGVTIAAPILCCMLIASAIFGILAKSMPTMNLLILGIPIRMGIAFLGIAFGLPMMVTVFQKYLISSEKIFIKLIHIIKL